MESAELQTVYDIVLEALRKSDRVRTADEATAMGDEGLNIGVQLDTGELFWVEVKVA